MCLRLADLVAPQSVHDFIHTTYAQSWIYREGEKHRFRRLADWETLNTLLATQRFESPRFRVARQGNVLSVESYTEQIATIRDTFYRRILVDRLLHELRTGATLAIDRVDQSHRPIGELATALELELKAQVFANMFASWMPVPGFDVHWDDHDVFVIQLEGQKRWQIFEPTRQWPLYRDIVENPKPEALPVADFEMTAGDLLYLPHGWWHLVSAASGPSLHITVGVRPDNGIDFMTWLVDQTRASELFRRRIPRFGDEYQRKEYLVSVRASLNKLIASDDILNQFLTYIDGTSDSRPLLGLPDILNTNSILDRKSARIVLLVPRATVTQTDDGFVLTALGRRWSFPLVAKPLIDVVLSLDHVTVGEAIKENVNVSEEQSAQMIFTLLRSGVLALQ